ncbi:hypothetical protein H6G93_10150 [Nostoc sp. FACHB-973]|nr:hypothetical protein [Nostoc sp. FACHB-973]
MNHEWVESMECGFEGIQRTKELADFLETAPHMTGFTKTRSLIGLTLMGIYLIAVSYLK